MPHVIVYDKYHSLQGPAFLVDEIDWHSDWQRRYFPNANAFDVYSYTPDEQMMLPGGVAMFYHSDLISIDGMRFTVYREPTHTDADVEAAKAKLLRDRDVVGSIKVLRITEWLTPPQR